MSLVVVRTPALQCKGGEGRRRIDIIRLRKGERARRRKRTSVGVGYIVSFMELGAFLCTPAPSWLGLSTDVG